MPQEELAIVPQEQQLATVDTSPPALIAAAVQAGASPEALGKLLDLQIRWEEREAMKAYHHAMAAFKANPPRLHKDKGVSFGQTQYRHATLASVTSQISAALSEHGLSASWTTDRGDQISVTCTITHEGGHSQSTTLTAPADTSGSKNAIQSIGSAVTYLQRYTLLALTGLAPHEDDDGAATDTPISNETAVGIQRQIDELGADLDAFCKYLKVDRLTDIRASQLPAVEAALASKRRRQEAGR